MLAQNSDGRLELFGVEADGKNLVHCFQRVPNGTNGWSEWSSLGGSIHTGFAARANAVPWLPDECVATPRFAIISSSANTALVAPRALNAPIF